MDASQPGTSQATAASRTSGEPWVEREPYPATEPASATDAAAIQAGDWAAFGALVRLGETRRVLPGAAGDVAYHWVLTFHGEHALGELAQRVQRDIAASEVGPAFSPVPVDRLNVPLVRVGGPAEAAGDALAAIEWAARQFCVTREALRLAVGPVFGAPGGVRLSVTPWDAVSDLRHGLRRATRESTALRPWLRELTPYRPHLTVAYATADVDAARVRPVLEELRGLRPIRLRVRRACLVRITPGVGTHDWHTLASVPIGARFAP